MEGDIGIAFWILSVIILVSGFMVVTLKNIFHCALYLIICLFSVAGIFVLLNAEFLAVAQVLIYVGAVSILMIFAVMLTSQLASKRISQTNENKLVGFFVSLVFAMSTIVLIANTRVWRYTDKELPADNIMNLGISLMTDFVLPFEVVSILLLASMIGAIALVREENS